MEQQYDPMVRAVLETFGLPGLQVLADAEGIAALERRPGSALRFAEALRRGIEAFLGDTQGSPGQRHDSAHDVVRADSESYGLGPSATDAEVTEALRRPGRRRGRRTRMSSRWLSSRKRSSARRHRALSAASPYCLAAIRWRVSISCARYRGRAVLFARTLRAGLIGSTSGPWVSRPVL